MGAGEIDIPTRKPRASRRRPDVPPPEVERIPPRSGLSRAEVMANQRDRIFDGLAAALEYHGYEDTKITDIVELAGVSRATFYEHFQGKDPCFEAAYRAGVEGLADAVVAEADEEGRGKGTWAAQLSAGLRAGLEFLADRPALANLLLVESLAAARPARLEHERSLVRLAEALRPPDSELLEAETMSEETTRLLAGGLASHLSGRVLANEADRLPESHDLLRQYLLAPSVSASLRATDRRRATGG